MTEDANSHKTKQERREERRKRKQEKMQQHGKGLARIYVDAIRKRLKRTKTKDGGKD